MITEVISPEVKQCRVVCADGVELLGLVSPPNGHSQDVPILLYLHGQFDNAYQQRVNHVLLEATVDRGWGAVLANTRGQDYYAYQRKFSNDSDPESYTWTLFGSSFEKVTEAPLDIEAWTQFAGEGLGQRRNVILIGHSHGAVKVANYLSDNSANSTTVQIVAAALLSPSDDIGGQRSKLGTRYGEALDIAKGLVESGRGQSYMPEWAYSSPMSAATYLEAFDKQSPLRAFALHEPDSSPLTAMKEPWALPTLVTFGEHDGATAGMPSEQAIAIIEARILQGVPSLSGSVIESADHHYRSKERDLVATILNWAQEISPGIAPS